MNKMIDLLEGAKIVDDKSIDVYSGSIYGSIKVHFIEGIPTVIRRDVGNVFFVFAFALLGFLVKDLNEILYLFNLFALFYCVIRVIISEIRYIEIRRVVCHAYLKDREKV